MADEKQARQAAANEVYRATTKGKVKSSLRLPLLSILNPLDDNDGDGAKPQRGQDDLSLELFRERVAEQKQRRYFRNVMFLCFFLLLLLQYVGLAVLVAFAVKDGFVSDIQLLLGIIVPATLGETYAIIRVMVNFVFSPGDFSNKEAGSKLS